MMEMGPELEPPQLWRLFFFCFNPSYDGNGAGTVHKIPSFTLFFAVSILLMMEMGPERRAAVVTSYEHL